MKVIEIQNKIAELKSKQTQEIVEHENRLRFLEDEVAKCEIKLTVFRQNIDVDKIKRAKEIIDIYAPKKGKIVQGQRSGSYNFNYSCVQDALNDLITGGKYMKTNYFGAKYYGGYNQRSDHSYDRGPCHGNIYFKVGFTNGYQGDRQLPAEQLEDCVYLLSLFTKNSNEKEVLDIYYNI